MDDRSDRETPARAGPCRRLRRHLTVLVGGLAIMLAATACGGNKPSEVASLGGSEQPTASATTGNSQDPRQAALDYAKCMRDHGTDMPDPRITGSGGNLDVRIDPPRGVNKKDPRVHQAQQACQHYLASGSIGGGNGSSPQQHQRELQFARCMRQHGIDMPDPRPDGGFVTEGNQNEDSPAFKAAERACQHYLDGPRKGGGK